MTTIVPSFIAKLDRAEKHLTDLRAEIQRYGGVDSKTCPFTVAPVAGKGTIHRLRFTRAVVNTEVPLIAADAIYNLRSGLDHLMGALVPVKRRDSVMFPIFWRGVWEAPVTGDNEQRLKDWARWTTTIKEADPKAVAFLRRLQPPDDDPNHQEPHALRLLNQISNKDRHTRLPLVAHGVKGLIIQWRLPDGSTRDAVAIPGPDHLLEDGAEIRNVGAGWEYVKCYGVPEIVIRTPLTNVHGAVNLPVIEFVDNTLTFIRDEVLPGLVSYVR